jgi:hypothetical protein
MKLFTMLLGVIGLFLITSLSSAQTTTTWVTVRDVSYSGGVAIMASPPDIYGSSIGTTPFYRQYNCPAEVTLSAPLVWGYNKFHGWELIARLDSTYIPLGDSTTNVITISMRADTVIVLDTLTWPFEFDTIITPCPDEIIATAVYRDYDSCEVGVSFPAAPSQKVYHEMGPYGLEHVIELRYCLEDPYDYCSLSKYPQGQMIYFDLPMDCMCDSGEALDWVKLIPEHGTGYYMRLTQLSNQRWQVYFDCDNALDYYDLLFRCSDGDIRHFRTNIRYIGYNGYASQGTIHNAVTGRLIPGVWVSLWRYGGGAIGCKVTGPDGTYDFGDVPAGNYRLGYEYWPGGPGTYTEWFEVSSPLPYRDVYLDPWTNDIIPPTVILDTISGELLEVNGTFSDLPAGITVLEVVPGTLDNVDVAIEEFRLGAQSVSFIAKQVDGSEPGTVTLLCIDRLGNSMNLPLILQRPEAYASISGFVTDEVSRGLLGVNIDIYNSEGTLWQSVVTDDSGYYHVDSIPNGDYSISVVTPLGYQSDQETKEFTVHHVPVRVDFTLTKLAITPRPRSRAYWANQLQKALQNKPQDYTKADFSRFAGLINLHFNQNQVNPVDFYSVTQPANQQDSLMVLKKILHMCQGEEEPFLKRFAKAQLMALMLNVVSGKISQTQVISADGRTASQAITYCDMLVNDEIDCPQHGPGHGSPHCRYILVDFILTFTNLGLTVPRGLIPEDVIEIAYRIHNQEKLPERFTLEQNYPNPFNPICEIEYDLPTECYVTLSVYNILGQKVKVLVDENQSAGRKSAKWDSKDEQGQEVTSGVYFYRIQAGNFVQSKKMILMK